MKKTPAQTHRNHTKSKINSPIKIEIVNTFKQVVWYKNNKISYLLNASLDRFRRVNTKYLIKLGGVSSIQIGIQNWLAKSFREFLTKQINH